MKSISVRAYAKVNLSLDVTGRLQNGYHILRSVMQAVYLFDELVVSVDSLSDQDYVNNSKILNNSKSVTSEDDSTKDDSTKDGSVSSESCSANPKYLIELSLLDSKQDLLDSKQDLTQKSSLEAIPTDSKNLAYRAAEKMMEKYFSESNLNSSSNVHNNSNNKVQSEPDKDSISPKKIRIELKKNIPVAAGLAGGSSDAAAVMLALASLLELDISLKELTELGKTIGADVPFCLIANAKNNQHCGFADDELASSTALAEGIGEKLTPIHSLAGYLIFLKPSISLSTPVVYSLYDDRENLVEKRPDTELFVSSLKDKACAARSKSVSDESKMEDESSIETDDENLSKHDDEALIKIDDEALSENRRIILANMVNVLEPIVRSEYPVVAKLLDELKELFPNDKVFMSGSGPTVVAYFDEKQSAELAYKTVLEKYEGMANVFYIDLL